MGVAADFRGSLILTAVPPNSQTSGDASGGKSAGSVLAAREKQIM